MTDSLTPEEKLLRLIKGQKKEAPRQAEPERRPAAQEPARPVPQKPLEAGIPATAAAQRAMGILVSYKALVVGMCAAAAYLAFSLAYPLFASRRPVPEDAQARPAEMFTSQPALQKPFEYYSQAPASRQIFSGSSAAGDDGAGQAATPDMLRDINLVGIITGDKPQAVIEDKKTQKTYYAAKGQSIGEYTVADIQEGKIIIHYKGGNFELYL